MSSLIEADNRGDLIRRYGAIIVAVLAVAASITGIRNTFAYDDIAVIVEDTRFRSIQNFWQVFTHTYWMPQYGGSLYRPLTTLGFALQWMAGGGSPPPVSRSEHCPLCISERGGDSDWPGSSSMTPQLSSPPQYSLFILFTSRR